MRTRQAYSTDLTEEEWQILQPFLPGQKSRGRTIKYERREIANAIFYLNRNGCTWRNLSHDFPPSKTVSHSYHMKTAASLLIVAATLSAARNIVKKEKETCMRIIFCADYWNPHSPESAYEAEANTVERLHLNYSLINFEALVEQQNTLRAVRKVEPASTEEMAIYRGWMLNPHTYARFATALAEKGLLLINTPAAYIHCHYLPESYHLIKGVTPRSTWIKTGLDVSIDEVMTALQPFGDKPVIIKDFVKSRKHEWNEACYIPSASDKEAVERVVTRFLHLQGKDLNEGLVFREFIEFEPLALHSKSGMPLIKEFRLFVLDGQIIFSTPYWEEGDYGNDQEAFPPIDIFSSIAQKIQSRFFTMDVARKRDGTWSIVELGDGQVAGLPARANMEVFYQALIGL